MGVVYIPDLHHTVHSNNSVLIPLTHCNSSVERPQVVISPTNFTVDAGSTTMLTCVGFSDPTSPITWSMEGAEVNNGSRINIFEDLVVVNGVNWVLSILEICSVDYFDRGQYSCTIGNAIMNATATFELTVNVEGGTLLVSSFRTICCLPFMRNSR